jgi:hypothetical protein
MLSATMRNIQSDSRKKSEFWEVKLSVTMINIQSDSRGKITILRGDIIGHYEKYIG